MLRAGSVNVGSHLASPVVGYFFMPPCCPCRRHGSRADRGSRRSAFQITKQYSPPEACAPPPGQEGAGGHGEGRARRVCSAASLLLPPHPSIHPSVQPAGPSVVAFPWGPGQPGSGRAPSRLLGVPWPLSAPPKSEQQSIPVSQTAPLCSSHVTIEGICF